MLEWLIAWTRVHAIDAMRSSLTESDAYRASTSPVKGKTVWEHSPTRRKEWEITRLNRGSAGLYLISVTAPLSHQGPTIPMGPPLPSLPATWRPSRASAWGRPHGLLPRVSATYASRGPAVALPRGLSATSHPHSGPARHVSSPPGPARHVTLQVSKIPFFCDFNKEKHLKFSLKIK